MAEIELQSDPTKTIELEKERTPAEIAEDDALALVVQDAANAEAWVEGQQWTERWEEIDILYDSPRIYRTWEQSTVMQPNVQRYIVSRHVNSIHPAMMQGLFSDNPPFVGLARPGTEPDAVRGRCAVITYQLEDMEFRTEVANGVFQDILHGTGIWKWGMKWEEVPDLKFIRKQQPLKTTGPMGEDITVNSDESDEFEEDLKTKRVLKPFFEHRELRSILVDASLRHADIRKAKFVIDKDFVTLADLLEMKKDPQWDLPAEETMRSWFETPKEEPQTLGTLDNIGGGAPSIAGQGQSGDKETTEDPSLQGLPRYERWDKYKVITTINDKKVIQNKKNPYGVLPFFSCNWFNRIRAFYGLGVGKIVSQDQRLSQGLTNSGLAFLQLLLDPPFAVDDDSNVATQNQRFRKGGFIKVKTKDGNVRNAIVPLEMPKLPLGELMTFLGNSESESEAADGANSLVMQGSVPSGSGKSSITRTGTGVNAFQGANSTRLQGPLDRFLDQVFIPWLYQLDELNTRFLPMSQVRDILGDELGDTFKLDEQSFKTGRMKFTALAATRMAATRIMQQSLPLITNVFSQPALQEALSQQNMYFDWLEISKIWLQSNGYPSATSIIKPMTAEMKQQRQASNPAAQKAQADAMKDDRKEESASRLLTQKNEEGMARDAVKTALQHGSDSILKGDVVHSSEEAGLTQ